MKTVLSIAGTDPTGLAGIQADLRTIAAHQLLGMSVITALIAQNSHGVRKIESVSPALFWDQLSCVLEEAKPEAVKIGMIADPDTIPMIVEALKQADIQQVVLDPVMITSSGKQLMSMDMMQLVVDQLFSICTLITPNLLEAQILSGKSIKTKQEALAVGSWLFHQYGCGVLIKGGHFESCADDLLYINQQPIWFEGGRIQSDATRGTGCRLSSAIACGLAVCQSVEKSVDQARIYLRKQLQQSIY